MISSGQVDLEQDALRLGSGELHGTPVMLSGDRDLPALRRQPDDVVEGAGEQQNEERLQPGRVSVDRGGRRAELDREAHRLLGGEGLEQGHDGPHQRIGIEGHARFRQRPGSSPELLQDIPRPHRLVRNGLHDFQSLGRGTLITAQNCRCHVSIGGNGSQRLVQVMGEPGGEVAEHVPVVIGRQRAVHRRPLRVRTPQMIMQVNHSAPHAKAPEADAL